MAAPTVRSTAREVLGLGKDPVNDINMADTSGAGEVDSGLVAAAGEILDAIDELGWDQPARLALIAKPGALPGDPEWIGPEIASGLLVRFPVPLEGHPCPSIAALGTQPAADGAIVVAEGWADRHSSDRIIERNPGCAEHRGRDGRLEYRMAILALRDGTMIQLSRPRGATTVDVSTQVGGRVPDSLGMTLGTDPDPSGIEVTEILRRYWMTMTSCHAALTYRDAGGAVGSRRAQVANDYLKNLCNHCSVTAFVAGVDVRSSGMLAEFVGARVSQTSGLWPLHAD